MTDKIEAGADLLWTITSIIYSDWLATIIIQLHFVEYKLRPKRVQISRTRYLYSREPVRQVSSQLASDELNWIEVTKQNGGQFKLFFWRRRVGMAGEYWFKFIR